MVILTYSTDTVYADRIRIPAGMSVVSAWAAAGSLSNAAKSAGLPAPRVSGTGHYIRHYCGQDLTGKSLCSWRGCGIGDQLMWSAMLAELRRRYPTATIHHYVPPAILSLCNLHSVYDVYPDPIPFDDWKTYDYHLIGENLCECDEEPDQGCHYDHLLQFAGIDPDTVSPEHKRPLVQPLREHCSAAADYLQRHRITPADPQHPLIIWQLASSNLQRAYPPKQTYAVLRLLAHTIPGATILILARDIELKQYPNLPSNDQIRICANEPLTMIAALLQQHASLVICPDSAIGHLAAAFPSLPVISLWGPFTPNDRTRYYTNHHPLIGTGVRQQDQTDCAPCRAHTYLRCPQPGRKWCRALASISPEQIRAIALTLLHP